MYNTTDALRSACLANKSMTFLALDSNHHYHTAKDFGINLNHYRERTAVVIYDMKVIVEYKWCRKIIHAICMLFSSWKVQLITYRKALIIVLRGIH